MSNPLDVAHGFGINDILLDILEELHDLDDPLVIIVRCETIDLEEGWPQGTALDLYLTLLTKTH